MLNADKKFEGIVTERDLSWFVAQAKDPLATRVAEIVSDFPIVVDGPIDDAGVLERMRTARRAPSDRHLTPSGSYVWPPQGGPSGTGSVVAIPAS